MSKPDLSEFEALGAPAKPRCKVSLALEQLNGDERDKLIAACEADRGIIATGAISKWLALRQIKVSSPAITAHRSGTCSCHAGA